MEGMLTASSVQTRSERLEGRISLSPPSPSLYAGRASERGRQGEGRGRYERRQRARNTKRERERERESGKSEAGHGWRAA